jgi:hypothetical protein
LEFKQAKSKKSLVFANLICDFLYSEMENVAADSLLDESLFLISSDDLCYENIIIYLQTQTFQPNLSNTDRRQICYQAVNILSSGILFIVVGLTQFFGIASCSTKLRKL